MYEHRLYIVNRQELNPPRIEGRSGFIFGSVIAVYNCSRMPMSFFDLFTDAKEIDFTLFVNQGDACVETKEDCYGNICTMLKLPDVISYLENLTDSGGNLPPTGSAAGLAQGLRRIAMGRNHAER